MNFKSTIIATAFLLFATISYSQPNNLTDRELESYFDKLLTGQFKPTGPGATAIVSRKGKVIYEKAFGKANMETGTVMEPWNILRIGSITKQFTAVSILQLLEKGKLNLSDSISKFIPGYPMHGQTITIEHLLTHTSGIKGYTELPEFNETFQHTDMKPDELISVFKNKPLEFTPGSKWEYSNSGYILLGYIIEKISGKSYAEYINENIFKPLGMTLSYYDNRSKIINYRAAGYQEGPNGIENASFISMTLPYAAGSIMSTVKDLNIWNTAIMNYKLLKKETLQKAITNYKLSDGKDTYYGYGWALGDLKGSPTIEHSGGIHGFLSNAIYLPNEQVYVAVLSNCTCNPPNDVSVKMAALAIGKPFGESKTISVDSNELKKYAGVYEHEDAGQRVIKYADGHLSSKRSNGQQYNLLPVAKDVFAFEDALSELYFHRDAAGNITGLDLKSATMQKQYWKKSNNPIPEPPQEMMVDSSNLEQFAGEYELAPQFVITVRVRDGKIFGQATGQPEFELFAKSENVFFLKVVEAEVEFIKTDGKVTSMILHQNGNDIPGKKK